jgi:tetratricopeptide (TPR) repeat protein
MKALAWSDNLHLQAAQGWLELGNHLEANEELERIAPGRRAHPDVLEVRMEIYSIAKHWSSVVTVADALVRLAPANPNGWVRRSYALHELKRTQEAYDQLLPVAEDFPSLWVILYNLACYTAQLGRLDEAQAWFKKAMAVDETTVKREAIADPDLQPLWDSLSGTMWMRE